MSNIENFAPVNFENFKNPTSADVTAGLKAALTPAGPGQETGPETGPGPAHGGAPVAGLQNPETGPTLSTEGPTLSTEGPTLSTEGPTLSTQQSGPVPKPETETTLSTQQSGPNPKPVPKPEPINQEGGDIRKEKRRQMQDGGDGFRLGVDQEMVGGQAVVNGYDSELHTCGGYGEELQLQEGGNSPFNFIIDPDSGKSLSIFSGNGKALLKRYVKAYKKMQSGGAAPLEGVDPNEGGALYDGGLNAGAEYTPEACGLTYDATAPVWEHTQVGGGKKRRKSKSRNTEKKDCNCPQDCESCTPDCKKGGDCKCLNIQ